MARAAGDEFWNVLHQRWRGEDPKQEAAVILSVFWHLANRLPGPEAVHVEQQLPEELRELWPAPEPRPNLRRDRRVQKLDYEDFLGSVSEEAELPDHGETATATRAVFHALGHILDDEERRHVAAQLPPDLRKVWNEEVH